MSEVNLLEGILLSDEQIEMLAFAIKPQDIKNYINEHEKEYQRWLLQEATKQFYEKYGDIMAQRLREKLPELVENMKTSLKSLMLKAK